MTRYLIIYAKRYEYKTDKTNVYDMVIANIIFESTDLVLDHICMRDQAIILVLVCTLQ